MKREQLVEYECYAFQQSHYSPARRAIFLGVLPVLKRDWRNMATDEPTTIRKPAFAVAEYSEPFDGETLWFPEHCPLGQIRRTWAEYVKADAEERRAFQVHMAEKAEHRAHNLPDARKVRDALGIAEPLAAFENNPESAELRANQLADGHRHGVTLDDIRRLVKLAREGALHLNDPDEDA